ncbi:MAG: DUF4126 domain-containing protein [Leptolinea sp.]
MELLNIFSAFGLSASAGLNAYIPLLTISLLAKFTHLINLREPWNILTDWWIIGILVGLSLVEFFADKIPAVNHFNDVIQTFVRPAAGAVAFAASANVVTNVHPVLAMGLGLLIAGGVHVAKAGLLRPAVTATTGGTANVAVSMAEDFVSLLVSFLSVVIPVIIAAVIIIITAWIVFRMKHSREKDSQSVA